MLDFLGRFNGRLRQPTYAGVEVTVEGTVVEGPEDLERFFYLDAVALAEVAKKRGPPVHLTAQNGDLMPERENLDLPGLVTAPEQDQELEETTEDEVDEVEEGPQHK